MAAEASALDEDPDEGCERPATGPARGLAAGLAPTVPLWSVKLASAYSRSSTATATRLVLAEMQQETGAALFTL